MGVGSAQGQPPFPRLTNTPAATRRTGRQRGAAGPRERPHVKTDIADLAPSLRMAHDAAGDHMPNRGHIR